MNLAARRSKAFHGESRNWRGELCLIFSMSLS
jgi:hypothetical protein